MPVELATAYISLVPSLQGAQGKLAEEFGGAARQSSSVFGSVFSGTLLGNIATDAIRGVGKAIGSLFGTGFAESREAEVANAQLTAAIQSTGNAANVSIGELNSLASSIQAYSGQTDDSIAATQALLLRFTSIRNVGADRIFDDATRAAADMAARLGGDAASQAQKLGRALEDPIAGVNQLARSGVIFTDQQKAQIAAMVEAGDTLGAQRAILDQVNVAYGGSAAAFGNTFDGALSRVKRGFEDFSQATVTGVLPLFTPILSSIANALVALTPAAEKVGAAISSGIGQAMEVVGPLFTQLGATLGPLIPQFLELWASISPLALIFGAIQPFLPQLLAAFGELASVVGGALGSAFQELAPVLKDVGKVVSGLLGSALEALLPVFLELVGIVGPLFSTVLQALLPIIIAAAGIFSKLVSAVLPLLEPILGLVAPIAQLVASLLPPLIELFVGLLGPILGLLGPLIDLLVPVLEVIVGVLAFIVKGVVEAITWFVQLVTGSEQASKQLDAVWSGVLKFFGDLWDTIVGFFADGINSAIEFVTGIPDAILAALGDLGKLLFTAGKDLFQGFIDGINAMLKPVGDAIGGVLDFVGGFFPHSPAERGPFSGAGWRQLRESGLAIAAQFGTGIDDGRSALSASLYGLTTSGVAASVNGSYVDGYAAADASARMPKELVVIDADGQLIGRMQVEADGRIRQYDDDIDATNRGGIIR